MSQQLESPTDPIASYLLSVKTMLAAICILLLSATSISPSHAAEVGAVGEVEFSKGAVSAQRISEPVRILGRGASVYPGDVIKTASRSFLIVKFIDGTRMTLRPDTIFAVKALSADTGSENAIFSLVKGGFRVLTGLISKAVGGVFKVETPVATIGVRGTEFDARLCAESDNCDAASIGREVAKFVDVNGALSVHSDNAPPRQAAPGAGVNVGDELISNDTSSAVVGFRDGTLVTIQPNTRFRVEQYQYDGSADGERGAIMRLLVGSMRVFTGAIAKLSPARFKVNTPTATIGVRGTGFDVGYDGQTHVRVWDSCIDLGSSASSLGVCAGESAIVDSADDAPENVDRVPAFMDDVSSPRPDSIDIDVGAFFAAEGPADEAQRLYVSVSEGVVILEGRGADALDIGQSQSAVVTEDGEILLLETPPPFMLDDALPKPAEINEAALESLGLLQVQQSPFTRASESNALECTVN